MSVDVIPATLALEVESEESDIPRMEPAAVPDLLVAVQLPGQLSATAGSLDCSLQVWYCLLTIRACLGAVMITLSIMCLKFCR